MNEREQAHLAALEHGVWRGARGAAVAVLDRHLMRYPFDLVAHQAATLLDGFLGRFRWVRDRTARALPLWSKDSPATGPCSRSTASAWRKPAITPAPRTSRARRPNSNRTASGRITPSRM